MSEKDINTLFEENNENQMPDIPKESEKISLGIEDLNKDDAAELETEELSDDTPLNGVLDSMFSAISSLDPNHVPENDAKPKNGIKVQDALKNKMHQLKVQREQKKQEEEAQIRLSRQAAPVQPVQPQPTVQTPPAASQPTIDLEKKVIRSHRPASRGGRRRYFTAGRLIKWALVLLILFGVYKAYRTAADALGFLNFGSLMQMITNVKDKVETGMDGVEIPSLDELKPETNQQTTPWQQPEEMPQPDYPQYDYQPETQTPVIPQPETNTQTQPEEMPQPQAPANPAGDCESWGGSYQNGTCVFGQQGQDIEHDEFDD